MKKQPKVCKNCQKEYKSDNLDYCCKQCQLESTKERNKKTCVSCSSIFYQPRKSNVKTCSKECNSKLRSLNKRGKIKEVAWEIRSCPICTTEFKVRIKHEKIYCSDECRYTHYLNNKESIDKTKLEKQKKTLLERYGVESPMKIAGMSEILSQIHKNKTSEEIQESIKKAKKTKLDKYGDENYRDVNKRKITCLERYGDENYNNRPKFMKTIVERYGDFHLRLPEFQEKCKNTFLERYGVKGVLGIDEFRERAIQAHLDKFDGKWFQNSGEFADRLNKSQSEVIKFRLDKFNFIWLDEENFVRFSETRYLKLQCKKCDNIMFSTLIKNNLKPICRKCFPSSKYSSINLFMQNYIKTIYDGELIFNNRTLIRPYEIDIYLSEYNLGFEMNGNYYHSSGYANKSPDYHIIKTKLGHNNGIRIIQIFEDEVEYNERVLKSFVDKVLGKSNQIQYPQNLDIAINIDENVRIEYIKRNSLYDYIKSDFDIILYKDDIIYYMVCIRIDNQNNFTIVNEITLLNNIVINGLDYVIDYILENYVVGKIKYISNIRLNGLGYLGDRFKSISITKPNKYYINKIDYYHRSRRITGALLKRYYNNMVVYLGDENKMDHIFDCGNEVFELK
jgi:hypothetical protein